MRRPDSRFASTFATLVALMLAAGAFAQATVKPATHIAAPLPFGASPPPPVLRGPKPRGWLSPQVAGDVDLLYVAEGPEVLIFPQRGRNRSPIGAITEGVESAYGLYVDRSRNLYVCNWRNNFVAEYAPGTTTPSVIYTDGLFGPLYVTVDRRGTLFVANGGGGKVIVFRQGQTTPTRVLVTPGSEADGLDVDGAGNLYVAYRHTRQNNPGGIMFFPHGSSQGTNLGMVLRQPQGLTIDPNGNILVVETGPLHRIEVFPPGRTTPSKKYVVPGTPTQVVLGRGSSRLYMSSLDREIYELRYPDGHVRTKIGSSMLGPIQGLAVSPAERP